MNRAAAVGIGAAFTTLVALRASAQVVVGMRESYIQPPPTLSGTLICRGGDELLFEGPLTTVRTRASLVPPGNYSLTVEGLTLGGKPIAAGRFPFRVLPPV